VVNYDLPINKLPFLAFVKSSYSYTGDYSWQRSSLALSSVSLNGVDYNLGNTIQNAGSHRLNTAFNMETFYKYIRLGKKPATTPSKPTALPKPGEKITNTKAQPAGNTNVFLVSAGRLANASFGDANNHAVAHQGWVRIIQNTGFVAGIAVSNVNTRFTYTNTYISFNGNTSNFSSRELYGTGSAVGSGSSTTSPGGGQGSGYVNATSTTASTFSNNEIYIPNYTSSVSKSFLNDFAVENNATLGLAGFIAGLWNPATQAAITSITLIPDGANWVQYSTATLYGISKS
jgi:cell surface protein SprA